MRVHSYVWLGVSWNVSPMRYRKLATVLHHNNISASCMCVCARACVCGRERERLWHLYYICHISESHLMEVTNFQKLHKWTPHTRNAELHEVIKIIKKNKQQAARVCAREFASALTQCVSVFVIQPSQRKQSLSSIPLLSPSSLPPSLSWTPSPSNQTLQA